MPYRSLSGPPPSRSVGEQAGARLHRVGQTEIVDLVTLSTKGTFNDSQVLNNLRKAAPGMLTQPSENVFGRGIAMRKTMITKLSLTLMTSSVRQEDIRFKSIDPCLYLQRPSYISLWRCYLLVSRRINLPDDSG